MGLSIEYDVIIAYALGLLLLYIVGWLLLVPFKIVLKFLLNGIIGGVVLWILNMLSASIGIHIALNPVNALVVGILGIPGIILLLLLQCILGV